MSDRQPPADEVTGVVDQPDLAGEWGDEVGEAAVTLVRDPVRNYLTLALLGLVAIVVLTLLGLVGARRISVAGAAQLGGVVLSPLFTLLGLAAAYFFRQGDRS